MGTLGVVGRELELMAVEQALQVSRLVTLVGPPGIGKTSIARAVERSRGSVRGDRVVWLDLTGVGARDDADALVAATLASVVDEPSLLLPGRDAFGTPSWLSALRGATVSMVLDACECDLGAACRIVELFLEASDGWVLATSRQRLALDEGVTVAIGPLALPDGADADDLAASPAVGLLLGGREVSSHEDRAALAQIARHLDGVPAALVLCRELLATFTPLELLGRLDALPHAASLEALVSSSWAPLHAEARSVLVGCSGFEGPFSLDDLEAVVPVTLRPRVVSHLDALVAKSLVARDHGDAKEDAAVSSFRVLRVVRSFVIDEAGRTHRDALRAFEEGLVERAEAIAPRSSARFSAELATLVKRRFEEGATDGLLLRGLHALAAAHPRGEPNWLDEALRAVLDRSRPTAMTITLRLDLARMRAARVRFGDALREAALACAEADGLGEPGSRQAAWLALADLQARAGRREAANMGLARAAALAASPDERFALEAARVRVSIAWRTGTPEEVRDGAVQGLSIAERAGSRELAAFFRLYAGQAWLVLGNQAQAERMLARVRDDTSGWATSRYAVMATTASGLAAIERGDLDGAVVWLEAAVVAAATKGAPRDGLWARGYLGAARFLRGEQTHGLEDAALLVDLDEPLLLFIPLFATVAGSLVARSLLLEGLDRLGAGVAESPWLAELAALMRAIAHGGRPSPPPLPPAFQLDLSLCRRMLRVSAAQSDAGAVRLEVAEDGRWFRCEGDRISLQSAPTSRRLLLAFVAAHRAAAGSVLSLDDLRRAAWPGDRSRKDAAANRIYVALSRLRDRGLRDVIVRTGEGWCFSATTELTVC